MRARKIANDRCWTLSAVFLLHTVGATALARTCPEGSSLTIDLPMAYGSRGGRLYEESETGWRCLAQILSVVEPICASAQDVFVGEQARPANAAGSEETVRLR